MHDSLFCPICFQHLKSAKPRLIKLSGKSAHYIYRYCLRTSHSLSFYTDKVSGKIDFLKFCPTNDYSTVIEIDYIKDNSIVKCMRNGVERSSFELNEAVEPDFPTLEDLKNTIETLILLQ